MTRQKYFAFGLCFILILGVCSALADDRRPTYSSEMNMAREALEGTFAEIGLQKGDDKLLVLTNAGYVIGEYCRDKMPLRPGEQYIFVTAPAICPADALQVIFNTTAGKSSGYSIYMSPALSAKYEKEKVRPMTVAMRVNRKADVCEGTVIGFDWNKAYGDTGVKAQDMAPPGGPSNPMFWIARVKMSRELARLPRERLLVYIVGLKRFAGNARLADEVAGGDPYVLVWNR